ncbi:glycosyltransferase family 39 protein [bacterium]|nr:glycosyltransferase family 39 protein [bacterium]
MLHRHRLPLLLILVGLLAYANAPLGEYVYDDVDMIRDREAIEDWSNLPKLVSREFGPVFGDLHYRPLAPLTYFIDAKVFGKSPLWSGLINVVLHIATGLLLFGLWRRALGRDDLAWWAAAFFLCHPAGSEVVNSPGFRRGLLALLFLLWTVWLLRTCVHGGRFRYGLAAAGTWFLGLLAKEPAFVAVAIAPAVLLFEDIRESGMTREAFHLFVRQRRRYSRSSSPFSSSCISAFGPIRLWTTSGSPKPRKSRPSRPGQVKKAQFWASSISAGPFCSMPVCGSHRSSCRSTMIFAPLRPGPTGRCGRAWVRSASSRSSRSCSSDEATRRVLAGSG